MLTAFCGASLSGPWPVPYQYPYLPCRFASKCSDRHAKRLELSQTDRHADRRISGHRASLYYSLLWDEPQGSPQLCIPVAAHAPRVTLGEC